MIVLIGDRWAKIIPVTLEFFGQDVLFEEYMSSKTRRQLKGGRFNRTFSITLVTQWQWQINGTITHVGNVSWIVPTETRTLTIWFQRHRRFAKSKIVLEASFLSGPQVASRGVLRSSRQPLSLTIFLRSLRWCDGFPRSCLDPSSEFLRGRFLLNLRAPCEGFILKMSANFEMSSKRISTKKKMFN